MEDIKERVNKCIFGSRSTMVCEGSNKFYQIITLERRGSVIYGDFDLVLTRWGANWDSESGSGTIGKGKLILSRVGSFGDSKLGRSSSSRYASAISVDKYKKGYKSFIHNGEDMGESFDDLEKYRVIKAIPGHLAIGAFFKQFDILGSDDYFTTTVAPGDKPKPVYIRSSNFGSWS